MNTAIAENISPTHIPTVYTVPQCAEAYGLPPFAIRRWIKEGKLKAVHSGRKMFINADVLNDFLRGMTVPTEHSGGIRIVKE